MRRSIRLAGFDYRNAGTYFVTLNTKNRARLFGEIRNGIMGLSEMGCVVVDEIRTTTLVRPYVDIPAWIVMPDHVHLLIHIDDEQSLNGRFMARHEPTWATIEGAGRSFGKPQPRSLSTIVGALKSAAAKRINESNGSDGTIWQRNFYEYIVRSDGEYQRIRRYIALNPRRWTL